MGFSFNRNTKDISEINNAIEKNELIVDTSYQRRKVWSKQDKVRLIETILMGYIIPEVFFWKAKVNSETGKTITHIVDGQQRIDAIVGFINGEFKLSKNYLLNADIKNKFSDLTFKQLPETARDDIWLYKISVVDIDRNCDVSDIKQMFYRLNLTEYSLNKQEKRNSQDSKFGDAAENLSENEFWKQFKVFSASDYKRMKDIEFCCSIYILANQGIVDQTNDTIINNYYEDYKNTFENEENLTNRIFQAMDIIKELTDNTMVQFVSKKSQMYTMLSMAFYMVDEKIEASKELFEKLKNFIIAYNDFKNEFIFDFEDERLREVYEDIKRYKLAASEGINKYHNRTIRFGVLKDILFTDDKGINDKLLILSEKFRKKKEELYFEEIETEED